MKKPVKRRLKDGARYWEVYCDAETTGLFGLRYRREVWKHPRYYFHTRADAVKAMRKIKATLRGKG